MTRQFAEDCIDVLKNMPGHRLPFKRFIPEYNKQFKRQCRFADYGFTTLIEMFAAIPNTVQITKDGDGKKIVRLNRNHLDKSSGSYRSRQGSDSSQGHNQRRQRSHSRSCQRGRSRDRIQNRDEEVSMTRKFAKECTDLLGNVPGSWLLFERFMPAYLKYFKRQCRVADYGFTKLIEMFEAIPNTVKITYNGEGKRVVRLDPKYLDKSSGRSRSRQGSDSSQGYGNTGCRVFNQGVQNKIFLPKNQHN